MSKWIVSIPGWEVEIEAEREGDALMDAERQFSFMSEARAEEVESEDGNEVNHAG